MEMDNIKPELFILTVALQKHFDLDWDWDRLKQDFGKRMSNIYFWKIM